MRIAIFTETFLPKWDGIANTLCHLLDHLSSRGHESLMFAPQGAPEQYADTPIIGLPSFAFPFYPELKLVPPIVDVEEYLMDFKPDLVHLVNLASLGLVGMRHARNLNIPIVASYHTDLPGYAEWYGIGFFRDPIWAYFRWLHNQADLNLCPSSFTKSQLIAHGFQRVKVWGRGVDIEQFNPRHRHVDWRMRLTDGHPDAPLLLYVGRLASEKRVDWLRPVLDVLPEARLAIVGDGPMREELEQDFEGTKTVFAGYLEGHDLACAYAAADLFTFPSASETFGNVVLEAMASGLPVITPASGGAVDHISTGENGFLFDPDDQASMITLIQDAASDLEMARQVGHNARAYVEGQTWDVVLDGLLEDYETVIEDFNTRNQPPQKPAERIRRRHLRSGRHPRTFV